MGTSTSKMQSSLLLALFGALLVSAFAADSRVRVQVSKTLIKGQVSKFVRVVDSNYIIAQGTKNIRILKENGSEGLCNVYALPTLVDGGLKFLGMVKCGPGISYSCPSEDKYEGMACAICKAQRAALKGIGNVEVWYDEAHQEC